MAHPSAEQHASVNRRGFSRLASGGLAGGALLIADPSLGLYSATNAAKGNVLTQTYTDTLAEIVVGRSPVSNLDQIRNDWRSGGGNQIRAEIEQASAASKA